MLFRQIVFYSLLVGIVSGLVLTAIQTWQVVPIIQDAELYEEGAGAVEVAVIPALEQAAHTHGDAEEWAPANGFQRTAFTLLSNIITAMGFAMIIMVAMMASLNLQRSSVNRLDWRHGLIWGAAGYVVFWLAPAVGLPPEIPLQVAAPLEQRQLWWVFAALCTAGGLAGLAFARSPWRWIAPVALVVPHLVGAPHPEGPMFGQQPPEVAMALEALAQQFLGATAIANGALWLVLGLASAWAVQRIVVSMKAAASMHGDIEAPLV
jgi:cobalt transporter subunit CbtA